MQRPTVGSAAFTTFAVDYTATVELISTFYNVENLYDTTNDKGVLDSDFTPEGAFAWDEERYKAKLANIAEVLFATGTNGRPPAFIGLSEVENREVLRDLLLQKGLNDTSYGIVHADSRDVRGIDVAFLYNRNFFTPHGFESLNFEKRTQQVFGARDILHVWGSLHDSARSEMHFFVNHWPSRHGGEVESRIKRSAAAATLSETIDQIFTNAPEAYVLAMGDFNDEPRDESLRSILNAGEDVHHPQKLVNLAWASLKRNEGTTFHDGEWYLFDQIMVSSNLLDEQAPYIKRRKMYIYDEGDVIFREPRSHEGRPNRTFVGRKYKDGYSDHLAVYVRLFIDYRE